jgi:hypothetical protein
MAETTYTGQIVREAPEIEAYKVGLLEAARQQVGKPVDLPAVQAAGLSDLQLGATQLGTGYMQGGAGVGGYAPFLQQGANAMQAGLGALGQAGQGIAGINVNPYYDLSQQGMTAAAQAASGIGGYAQLMGGGYKNIATGTTGLENAMTAAKGVTPDFTTAGTTLGSAATTAQGATGAYDPTSYKSFMSPYQQDVIDEAVRQIDRQGQLAQQGLSAQAVRSGAFGGTREGVQRAELGRNLAETKNAAIINALQQGYGSAQQQAQQAFEQQQQRGLGASQALAGIGSQQGGLTAQQAGLGYQGAGLQAQIAGQQSQQGLMGAQIAGQQAGLLGQQAGLQSQIAQGIGSLAGQQAQTGLGQAQAMGNLASQYGQFGGQYGTMGAQSQALAQGDLNTYLALGGLQQQTAQQELDAQRATQTQKNLMPYQQLGFLSDIYKGAPSSSSTLLGQTAPGTSPLLSAIGTGIAGVNAAAGASKAGLFSF